MLIKCYDNVDTLIIIRRNEWNLCNFCNYRRWVKLIASSKNFCSHLPIKDIFMIPVVTIASVHIFERTCDAKAMQTRKTNETQALAWEENVEKIYFMFSNVKVPIDDPRKFGLIAGIGENNAIAVGAAAPATKWLCRSNGLESMEGRVTLAKSIESFNHEAFRQHNSHLINPIAADNSTLILL
ncbi:hypothetical protein GQX74_010442 [Glossina fuscipes]|nr:hypothetical protein GQX74_010442 [Glossina fuscipes]